MKSEAEKHRNRHLTGGVFVCYTESRKTKAFAIPYSLRLLCTQAAICF